MIPATWEPYYRSEDGELIGYLRPADESAMPTGESAVPTDESAVVPVTLFGHPLDAPMDRFAAERTLEDAGLSYLAEPWLLRHEDGSESRVAIVEVDPDRLVVANADYALVAGTPVDIGERRVLDVPTDRLRPARP